MKIPYFPGCTLQTSAKNFDVSARAAADTLGIELVELEKWNCCGTVYSLAADNLMNHLAPIRNLIRTQEMIEDGTVDDDNRLVTLCSICFNTMKSANDRLRKAPGDLGKINDFMYREKDYKGDVEVVHFLELLNEIGFDKVKEKIRKPLMNLKISPYYGCMLLRPKEMSIDDSEDPTILEELMAALGAVITENPHKKMCCGTYQTARDKAIVVRLAREILSRAVKEGADAIITSCPLCAFNLDGRQEDILDKHPNFEKIPVFYFTQLMAVAFGLGEEYYGFDQNYTDPRPLLKEKGLLKGNGGGISEE